MEIETLKVRRSTRAGDNLANGGTKKVDGENDTQSRVNLKMEFGRENGSS